VSSKYRRVYQFCYVKLFSTNQNENLLPLGYPGRVRSQITSVVSQIQRFDFDCILVVSRKLIIWTHPPLRLKPLYTIGLANARNIPKYPLEYRRGPYLLVLNLVALLSDAHTKFSRSRSTGNYLGTAVLNLVLNLVC
jgi:hypothetical protein